MVELAPWTQRPERGAGLIQRRAARAAVGLGGFAVAFSQVDLWMLVVGAAPAWFALRVVLTWLAGALVCWAGFATRRFPATGLAQPPAQTVRLLQQLGSAGS